MTYTNDILREEAGLLDRLAQMIKSARERRAKYRIYQITMHELNGLSDRDLVDLGIHRSMIGEIAHEAAYGK